MKAVSSKDAYSLVDQTETATPRNMAVGQLTGNEVFMKQPQKVNVVCIQVTGPSLQGFLQTLQALLVLRKNTHKALGFLLFFFSFFFVSWSETPAFKSTLFLLCS